MLVVICYCLFLRYATRQNESDFLEVPQLIQTVKLKDGVRGVFLAEPVSNVLGGTACYLTMRLTQYRRIRRMTEQAS